MRRKTFRALQTHLLSSGVTRNQVNRITAELRDHLEDLYLEALSQGLPAKQALVDAKHRLGDQQEIARRILERTELKTWLYRYPRVARFYLPVAYAILLPAIPVFAGMANPFKVARWGAALMLGGVVTAGMLLCMQLAIIIG